MQRGITCVLLCLFVLSLYSCNTKSVVPAAQVTADTTVAKPPYPMDLKWVRQSVEYPALCRQLYKDAWPKIKALAAETEGDWAVVLDVDETVLNNSGYQQWIYEENTAYPNLWEEWTLKAICPPIPGAKAFLDSVRALGPQAHIVFITNRMIVSHDATLKNLKDTGLWDDRDILMCRKDQPDNKEIRRQEVINGTGRCEGRGPRTIIALFGDQLGDFFDYKKEGNLEAFIERNSSHDDWGKRYFLLPNPMYGYWEFGYGL